MKTTLHKILLLALFLPSIAARSAEIPGLGGSTVSGQVLIDGYSRTLCDLNYSWDSKTAQASFSSANCNNNISSKLPIGFGPPSPAPSTGFSAPENPISTMDLNDSESESDPTGLGISAASVSTLANWGAYTHVDFSDGDRLEQNLKDFSNNIYSYSSNLQKSVEQDGPEWAQTVRPFLTNWEAQQASLAKQITLSALSNISFSEKALAKLEAQTNIPLEIADRDAALDGTSKETITQAVREKLSADAIRVDAPDFGGIIPNQGEEDSPKQEIQRERLKWQNLKNSSSIRSDGLARLAAANTFADNGDIDDSDALLNEARGLRYSAEGYTKATDSARDNKNVPLFERVTKFEADQTALAAKEDLLQTKIKSGRFSGNDEARANSAYLVGGYVAQEAKLTFYSGDLLGGSKLQEIASSVFDVGLGFVPIANAGKDLIELVTGHNYITGMDLSKGQRVLAAIGVLTLGGAEYVGTLGKSVLKIAQEYDAAAKIINAAAEEEAALDLAISAIDAAKQSGGLAKFTPKAIDTAERLNITDLEIVKEHAALLEKVPESLEEIVFQDSSSASVKQGLEQINKLGKIADLNPVRYRAGDSLSEVTVIGRDMTTVETAGGRLESAGIKSRTFTPSGAAEDSFDAGRINIPGGRYSYEQLQGTEVFQENKLWIEASGGRPILDIGDPLGKSAVEPSAFYDMEIQKVFGAQK